MLSRNKKEEESGELGIFTHLDKALVIQDTKIFNDTPLKIERCSKVLTKLLYLIYQGEKLNNKDSTNVFFAVTKSFQSKDPSLRRLVYLVIKELAPTANDIIMVISSLNQDMNLLPAFKSSAIRALGMVVDSTMISGVERVIKQAIGDKEHNVCSSALTTSIHFFGENRDAVKRWLPEVQAALQGNHSRTITQFHALALLYLIKQHDRIAIAKLIQQLSSQSSNVVATCLNLRIYSQLISMDSSMSITPLDLKPFLRLKGKGDVVALEAARVICQHPDLYTGDVVFAITTLQMFLNSGRPLHRFAAIRALNDFANVAREQVAACNVEIESLVTDSNRNVATLAITTLLKTGNESSVDRLINQIMSYVAEISDEFKVIVVEAVSSLCLKFPKKYKTMLQFLGNILREGGGLEYKEATVNAIFQIVEEIPGAREPALAHLCEFIEDCEYPKLTAQVLHLLGEEGPKSENPARLIRYIYNRLILEDAEVRVSAVGALTKLALKSEDLKNSVASILKHCIYDEDDEVRDRAVVSLKGLNLGSDCVDYFVSDEVYDLEVLESQLLDYVNLSEAAFSVRPFDIQSVPVVSKIELFAKSRADALTRESGLVPTSPSIDKVGNDSLNQKTTGLVKTCRISEIPEFSSFGEVFNTSSAISLTEPDTEYVVVLRKHIFQNHLVLEFECRNTVRELVLENVQVQVQVQSNSFFKPLFTLPINKLSFDDPDFCFIAFEFNPDNHPDATISCSLRFTAFEVDPSTGERSGRGTTDEYPIDSFEIGISDYLRPREVVDFIMDWDKLGGGELVETLELQSMRSISEAVRAVIDLIDVKATRGTDRVSDPSVTTHTLLINGSMMVSFGQFIDFAIRARFAQGRNGVAVEIAIRSTDQSVSSSLLGILC